MQYVNLKGLLYGLWRTLVFNLRVQFSKNFWWGIVPFHKPLALGMCILCIYYLIEKTSSLIHSLAKQIKVLSTKGYIVTSCSCGRKSHGYFVKDMPLSFYVCQESFSVLSSWFLSVLAIWLRSLTVKISDVPCPGEVVGLSARKLGTVWPVFWNATSRKASIM